VLEAGKHAVVEKPFVTSTAEGEQLIALAKRKNRVLSAFQNRRWDGDFKTVKKVLDSGVLGQVVEFEAHYDRYRPEVDRSTWKELKGVASGILYNLGSHLIDQALDLFGMPESVTAHTGIQRTGGEAEDFYDIRMKYPQHYAITKSSYLVREPGPRYVIHGIKGSFIKYGLDPQEQSLKDCITPGTLTWGTESSEWWGTLNTEINSLHYAGKIETLPGNYLEYYDTVFDAIRNRKEPVVTAQEATNVIKIIELVMQSSKEGRTIHL
jgi:predicted dehydrogenase